jgi:hypothetical protein
VKFVATKRARQKNFHASLLLFLDPGSGMGKKIWIRDKHPGSATLVNGTADDDRSIKPLVTIYLSIQVTVYLSELAYVQNCNADS